VQAIKEVILEEVELDSTNPVLGADGTGEEVTAELGLAQLSPLASTVLIVACPL
jgi:hypothetical protein